MALPFGRVEDREFGDRGEAIFGCAPAAPVRLGLGVRGQRLTNNNQRGEDVPWVRGTMNAVEDT